MFLSGGGTWGHCPGAPNTVLSFSLSISTFHESKYHELVFMLWNSSMIKHCRLDYRDKRALS